MLRQTTWNEIKTRYAGSVLGLAWLVLYPLLFLGVYSVFIYILVGVRQGGQGFSAASEQVLLIFCGLIPFFGFSEALSGGVASVTSNANLLKNTLFPIELAPAKSVLVGQSSQVVGTVLLMLALAGFGKLTPWALVFPLIWVLQILLSMGLVWILSSLNVYFRDLQNVISVLILMLMLISPIAYKGMDVPARLLPLMYLNPLFYMIVCYQNCLLYGQAPPALLLGVLGVLACLFFFLGFAFFTRLKRVFADNV